LVGQDNQFRFIEAFVEKIDLKQMSFVRKKYQKRGQSIFQSKSIDKALFLWITQWHPQKPQIKERVQTQY